MELNTLGDIRCCYIRDFMIGVKAPYHPPEEFTWLRLGLNPNGRRYYRKYYRADAIGLDRRQKDIY